MRWSSKKGQIGHKTRDSEGRQTMSYGEVHIITKSFPEYFSSQDERST